MAASVALTVASVRKPQRCVVVRGDEDAPHEHRVTPNGAPPRAARQVAANEASVGQRGHRWRIEAHEQPRAERLQKAELPFRFRAKGHAARPSLALPRVAHPLPPHAHTGGDARSGYCVLAAGAPATPVRELALLTACAPTTTKPPTAPLFSHLRAATYIRDAGPATDRAALERAAARGLAMMCCDVCMTRQQKNDTSGLQEQAEAALLCNCSWLRRSAGSCTHLPPGCHRAAPGRGRSAASMGCAWPARQRPARTQAHGE